MGANFPPNFSRLHVFSDGARCEAGSDLLPGNHLCVPAVGHLRTTLFQRAVCRQPALVPRFRVELACLAPCRARCVARVSGLRRINQLPNGALVRKSCSLWRALSRFLAVVTAERARSRHELASAPEVQNQMPRRELAGIRARARPARRRNVLTVRRRDRRMDTRAVRATSLLWGSMHQRRGQLRRPREDGRRGQTCTPRQGVVRRVAPSSRPTFEARGGRCLTQRCSGRGRGADGTITPDFTGSSREVCVGPIVDLPFTGVV